MQAAGRAWLVIGVIKECLMKQSALCEFRECLSVQRAELQIQIFTQLPDNNNNDRRLVEHFFPAINNKIMKNK